ncbi:MAG: 4Fe-4S dicluster domain-containing protein [Proteobacteria bacterium]|nr:MAG: 4Fe-4S dicluster domain-containing protein [Pseudomonadota bacterium]
MFGIPTRRIRIAVQGLVFALWVGLILAAHYPLDSWLARHVPVSFFLRIDPLVATVVNGGLRMAVTITFLGFFTALVSIVLGRVFCGWVCPLGAIFDMYGWVLRRLRAPTGGPSPSWFRLKYYLLLAILLFAAFGAVSPLMGLDPIVLLTRVAAAVVQPFWRNRDHLTWVAGQAPGKSGYAFDALTLFLFLGIMAATTKLSRIWCRTVCPLGAYLAVLSRHAVLRRETSGCIQCGLCAQACPTGTIDFKDATRYNESECIKCFVCSQECPVEANFFEFKNPLPAFTPTYAPVELGRREFLGTAAAAVVAAPMMNLSGGTPNSHKTLLRPPLSRDEHDFLTSCIRCEECIKSCPTGILKPAPLEHGLRALWSPVMIPSEGFCMEGCNACSQACPTDAILKYPIEQKYSFKAGTAVFSTANCISYTENKFCNECVKVCPTDAILIEKGWEPANGMQGSSDQPAPAGQTPTRPTAVSFDRCVACGHCEFVCNQIVPGEVAMLTTSFGRAFPTKL